MDVGRATTALYLVPAAAVLIALVWLGQVPGPLELAGGGIALAGVVLVSSGPRPEPAGEDKPAGRIRPARAA